jgi:hypothetical protein
LAEKEQAPEKLARFFCQKVVPTRQSMLLLSYDNLKKLLAGAAGEGVKPTIPHGFSSINPGEKLSLYELRFILAAKIFCYQNLSANLKYFDFE